MTTVILGKATKLLPEVEGGGVEERALKTSASLSPSLLSHPPLATSVHFSRVVVIASSPMQRHSLTLRLACVYACGEFTHSGVCIYE